MEKRNEPETMKKEGNLTGRVRRGRRETVVGTKSGS